MFSSSSKKILPPNPHEKPSTSSVPDNDSFTVELNVSNEIPHHPPKSFVFPKTKTGLRTRSCQHQWFDQFRWLHYDVM